jgi:hypothetical protein
MHKSIVLCFACFFICTLNSNAKDIDSLFFRRKQSMLVEQYAQINSPENSKNKEAEIAFRDSFKKVLSYPDAPFFQFDSLQKIGRIISEDEKLIIYSWNIPQPGAFNNYYCILLYYNKPNKKYDVFVLEEKPGLFNKTPQAPVSISNWGGSLYYQIITTKYKGQTLYTLLGFDFNNLLSNRKVIEMLDFDEFSTPIFRQFSFLYNGQKQNRIIFEYAERAQMTVRYNTQRKMIVFDHLSPFKPSLEGQFQFYGPDLSFDGLIFEDGIWLYKSDISPEF